MGDGTEMPVEKVSLARGARRAFIVSFFWLFQVLGSQNPNTLDTDMIKHAKPAS